MTHEITMKSHQGVKDKKNKIIGLKVSTIDEEDEEDEASEENKDFTLITRKLKNFIKLEKNKGKKFQPRNDSQKELSNGEKDKRDLIYYKCKKPIHVKYDCPLYKNKANKKKERRRL